MKKIFLVLAVISFALLICIRPGMAENMGNKVCPITGEKIDEKNKSTYEHEGKTYNFCCPMCIDEFKKDPAKYIEKVEKEVEAESAPSHEVHGGHHH